MGEKVQAASTTPDSSGGYHDYVELLKLYDKAGNETMMLAELENILANLGDEVPKEDVQKLFAEIADPEDEDGLFPYMSFIVLVRCEGLLISGNFYRNKLKYLDFLKKRTRTNPKKGPFHFRAPSKMTWRVIRGMLPHKLKRGAEALDRLKVFDGMPAPYDKQKRMVVPSCMKVVKLKPHRKYAPISRLAHEVGWKYKGIIDAMEVKRKAKSAQYFQAKQKRAAVRKQAITNVQDKIADLDAQIVAMGCKAC